MGRNLAGLVAARAAQNMAFCAAVYSGWRGISLSRQGSVTGSAWRADTKIKIRKPYHRTVTDRNCAMVQP